MLFGVSQSFSISIMPARTIEAKQRVRIWFIKWDEEGSERTNTYACEAGMSKIISVENIARMNRKFNPSAGLKNNLLSIIKFKAS